MPSSTNPRPAPPRLPALDALRGLIMVLMAIDHAAFHIAKKHPGEFWGLPLPQFPDAAAFLTRFVTHLCAPGFFFLMGVGITLMAAARRRTGWSDSRVARHLVLRGLLLLLIQQLLENPTWGMGFFRAGAGLETYGSSVPGSGGAPLLFLGVLFGLGANLALGAPLLRLPTVAIGAVGVTAVLATQLLTPGAAQAGHAYSPVARMLLVPGQTGPLLVLYPVLPWLGFTAFGLVFGRLLLADQRRAFRTAAVAGVLSLAGFAVVRLAAGFGNLHPPADAGWIAFLNVTKYPPSLAFLLLTLGANLVLLVAFQRLGTASSALAGPLRVFGGTALFFYVAHLWLYMLLGLAFPRGTGLGVMYGMWLVGLLILYPLCRRYGDFRRSRPIDSIWRMF